MAFHTPGGGEMQLLNYKNELEELGHQVDLFDPWKPNFMDYDIVHYFSCVFGSEAICRFVKELGLPLVISSSLWVTDDNRDCYSIETIKAQLDLADCIITNSMMESDALSNVFNIERKKFHHVYNAAGTAFFDAEISHSFVRKYDINTKYILNVGNIEPRKNQHSLIEAMRSIPDYKLVLIGHVRDKEYYDKCKIEGNEQVIFIGDLAPDSVELISSYQNAAAFCLPSTLETPGIAALEAAAVGTTIVITKGGSTKEYFGESAYFVEHSSINNIASGLRKGLSNPKVPRGIILPWNKVAKNLEHIYFFTVR